VLPNQLNWKELSDRQLDEMMQRWIADTADDPAVYGYYLKDEPGAADFPGLARAVAALKRLAPDKIAYINLFPNYATLGANDLSQLQTDTFEEYLERFCTEVQPPFISYDNYQVQYSMDLENTAIAASYLTNLMQVRSAALKHRLPWRQIVSANQIRPQTTIPSPANLALQAYTSLAAGANCIDWYTYYQGGYAYAPVDGRDERSQTWYYLAEINRQLQLVGPQLNTLHSLGVYLLNHTAPGYPIAPLAIQDTIECANPLMVGSFGGQEGERYGMLVNLSLTHSAKITLKLAIAEGCLQMFSTTTGRYLPFLAGKPLWLTAGQGMLLRAL
ncbi:MAG: hypothetical protein LLG44_14060, partial [Chloroflexi bacterium]|nr:hypothetical protein [Chloroflexota bacterium]